MQVLRFDGYFNQIVYEGREQFHLRKVLLLYFLEDDTISVIEPPVENSGCGFRANTSAPRARERGRGRGSSSRP